MLMALGADGTPWSGDEPEVCPTYTVYLFDGVHTSIISEVPPPYDDVLARCTGRVRNIHTANVRTSRHLMSSEDELNMSEDPVIYKATPEWVADLVLKANRLVGNDADAAGLECTILGPTLRFHSDAVVALTGAPTPATLDGAPVTFWTPLAVTAGQVAPWTSCRSWRVTDRQLVPPARATSIR